MQVSLTFQDDYSTTELAGSEGPSDTPSQQALMLVFSGTIPAADLRPVMADPANNALFGQVASEDQTTALPPDGLVDLFRQVVVLVAAHQAKSLNETAAPPQPKP